MAAERLHHLEKIGDLKLAAKDEAGANAVYEEMLANDRALAAANPDVPDRQRDVSLSLEKIAKMKLDSGDTAGALALYEESLGIRRILFEGDRTSESLKQGLSFVIEKVGDIKRDTGDTAGALAAYQEMLGLDREVAAANIGDTKRQRWVSVDLNKIAESETRRQRHRRRARGRRGEPQYRPPHRLDRTRQYRMAARHLGQPGAARQYQVEHRRQAGRAASL